MDQQSFINEVKNHLSSNVLNSYLPLNNHIYKIDDYLNKIYINLVKQFVSPEKHAAYIDANISNRIISGNKAEYIYNYIQGHEEETYFIGVKEICLLDYIMLYCYPYMDDEFKILHGPKKITLDEKVEVLKHQKDEKITLIDKKELVESFLPYIENNILNFKYKISKSNNLREYILNELPEELSDNLTITINDNEYEIYNYIKVLVDKIAELLKDYNNKQSDDPSKVEEIDIDAMLTNTAQIKILDIFNDLTDQEKLATSKKQKPIKLSTLLSLIKERVHSINSNDSLEYTEIMLKKVIANNTEEISSYDQTLIDSIKEDINNKRKSLIKIRNNSEEYIDVLFNKINEIMGLVGLAKSNDDYSKINGLLIKLEDDVISKGIKDRQLNESLKELHDYCLKSFIIFDDNQVNISHETINTKDKIDMLFIQTKDSINSISSTSNKAIKTGLEIIAQKYIDTLKDLIENSELNNDDKKDYFDSLDSLIVRLDSNKRGYGLR